MTEFVSAVPIIPSREIEASAASYRDRLGIRIGVRGIDEFHERCQADGIVHPNAPLGEQPWEMREFAVVDHDGNLVTFFEVPS
jgi:uncharacterized glyoxalase superfamily protein PhnB